MPKVNDLRTIRGLGYMFFCKIEDFQEKKCIICGSPVMLGFIVSEAHFGTLKMDPIPCCQCGDCFDLAFAHLGSEVDKFYQEPAILYDKISFISTYLDQEGNSKIYLAGSSNFLEGGRDESTSKFGNKCEDGFTNANTSGFR